ncbi:hypothetical protein P170DRAFT_432340 [Aspergillus steynii IBT 23096]|uniref:Uncharacterized protein n=1 Tax=Aspergillus steynii IBT 23096 TaxID=1392250 RepID=A0A2I2GPC3_9EURO|nr:uncharacterized protein P170DRAFT_432340 [Aspergillus steynii IBT 23096]PLB54724.1 hypothetical protein P170DRAFT_432340 [Aspergillus steynii IBT 23096]
MAVAGGDSLRGGALSYCPTWPWIPYWTEWTTDTLRWPRNTSPHRCTAAKVGL